MSTVQWKRTDDQIPLYLRILYSDDTRSPLGCACKSRKDPHVLVRQPLAVRLDCRIELAIPLAGRPRHQQRTGPREHGADPARAVLAQRAEAAASRRRIFKARPRQRTTGRSHQVDPVPGDRPTSFRPDRRRGRRLADHSFEPEEPARDRGALRGNASLAEGSLKERSISDTNFDDPRFTRLRRLSTSIG